MHRFKLDLFRNGPTTKRFASAPRLFSVEFSYKYPSLSLPNQFKCPKLLCCSRCTSIWLETNRFNTTKANQSETIQEQRFTTEFIFKQTKSVSKINVAQSNICSKRQGKSSQSNNKKLSNLRAFTAIPTSLSPRCVQSNSP